MDLILPGDDDGSDIEGVKPEDVNPLQYADPDDVAAVEGMTDEAIDLHDSEIAAAIKILHQLRDKYSYRYASYENLTAMMEEAFALFQGIGLEVLTDWIGPQLRGEPPIITIVGRTTEYEEARQRHDVQSGVADKFWDAARKKADMEARFAKEQREAQKKKNAQG